MRYVLVTLSRGIIDNTVFFEDPRLAIQALSNHVRDMNPEHDDAALYDGNGFVANARHFLDERDRFRENRTLIQEASEEGPRPLYIIANPHHPLGFMVTSPDDPLGQMRKDHGRHLKLYRAIEVSGPLVRKADLERCNVEAGVNDFDYSLVEGYLS